VGQGDDVPTDPITVAVSLADKWDSLLSFFDIKEYPTGSKDPFALRRSAIAIIRLILINKIKVHTDALIEFWLGQDDPAKELSDRDIDRRSLLTTTADFLVDRLAVQQKEAGVRHDFVEASRRWLSRDDGRLDRIALRSHALQAFIATDDGANLHAGYKRAANILKKEDVPNAPATAPALDPADKALLDALDTAEPQARIAVEAEQFAAAMTALASLRAPIDSFFDAVMVNDPDADKRAFRLNLLARFRDAVHNVADFSKIEG
jgi:glycyl-tRNA synthetase beta chain